MTKLITIDPTEVRQPKTLTAPEIAINAYVADPDDPSVAVLKRDSKASIYTVGFPLLFVAGGIGMVVRAFLGGDRATAD